VGIGRAADGLEKIYCKDIMMISRRPIMVDILVRNIDAATAAQLKRKAKAAGKSVNDVAREALRAAAKPSKEEIWAEADRFRERIGKVSGDSTADIREWRDNDKPYR
jgi:antitoxin FitA